MGDFLLALAEQRKRSTFAESPPRRNVFPFGRALRAQLAARGTVRDDGRPLGNWQNSLAGQRFQDIRSLAASLSRSAKHGKGVGSGIHGQGVRKEDEVRRAEDDIFSWKRIDKSINRQRNWPSTDVQ